ncbi:nuclease [Campylobacter peloridis]|uniref:Nuclease n=1 Tax=Campylobacter peloridis TaxID=488546 RepID=A0A5C7DMM2_9BACT|nr:thermonuclease family protein [Campylobacter peloridis]TXE78893.1 nuclease [Campylobacter peloridis]
MKISKKQIKIISELLRDPKKFLIALFLLAFAYIINYDPNSYIQSKVDKIIDGDTIEVFLNDDKIKVRLFGIDAPEKDQAYGDLSAKFLSAIILNKEITLNIKDEDKYGRILAIVYLNDKDINQVMVKNGFAWAYEHYSDLYINDQNYAQENKKGLWEDINPIKPYIWRKQTRLQ